MRSTLFLILAILFSFSSTYSQTTLSTDDAESYGTNYEGINNGSGWNEGFTYKNFGGVDNGGDYIESGSRKITASKSFALYAAISPSTGKAVSRSFSPLNTAGGYYRISFRVRFDLNVSGGNTAGMVMCETTTASQANWNSGERLFIGSDGTGVWKFDNNTLQNVTTGGGTSNYTLSGGDVYLITLDIARASDEFAFKISNVTTSSSSDVMQATMGGTANATIKSIGFGNGVTGNNQNLIFDDVEVIENPTSPLPVELTTFSGKIKNDQTQLHWQTAAEINNSHFDIQRSNNSKTWENIGKVDGQGNSFQFHDYTFVDARPLNATNYYRLQQVDFDGKFSYSSIVILNNKTSPFEIYPNPVKDYFKINLSDSRTKHHHVQLINAMGQVIINEITSQPYLTIETHKLQTGFYLVRISDDAGNTLFTEQVNKL